MVRTYFKGEIVGESDSWDVPKVMKWCADEVRLCDDRVIKAEPRDRPGWRSRRGALHEVLAKLELAQASDQRGSAIEGEEPCHE